MSEIPDGEPLIFGRDFGWSEGANKWVIRKTPRCWLARPPIASFFYGRKIGAYKFDALLAVVVDLMDQEMAGLQPEFHAVPLKVGQ